MTRRRRSGFTMIELVAVAAIITVLISLLLPAVQSAREAARRLQCTNNLIQIGIALENYESTHRVYPAGSIDTSGPIIETSSSYQFGWITQILPYLEQKNTYKSLDFQKGIYQVENLTVRSVEISSLNCPSLSLRSFGRNTSQNFAGVTPNSPLSDIPDAATTSYAACHHDQEAPIDTTNNGVFFLNSHIRLDQIEDGRASTIFVGEKVPPGEEMGWASGTRATLRNTGFPINMSRLGIADQAAFLSGLPPEEPFTEGQPDNRPSQPLPTAPTTNARPIPLTVGGYGSQHPHGANFLMGDGSVRFLRSSVDMRVYRLMGNRRDGEPISSDQY